MKLFILDFIGVNLSLNQVGIIGSVMIGLPVMKQLMSSFKNSTTNIVMANSTLNQFIKHRSGHKKRGLHWTRKETRAVYKSVKFPATLSGNLVVT